MTEKTKVTGEIMAFSNPFSHQPSLNEIIMIRTDRGLVCVPVKDQNNYALHQEVEISISIKSKESRAVRDV